MAVAFHGTFLNMHPSVYLQRYLVVSWMVPRETAAVSAHVLCTPYKHAQRHFMQDHTFRMHVFLAVICQLHFWQNARDLLHAKHSRGGRTDTEIKAQTVDPGEENSPSAPARNRTRDLSVTSLACYH